MASGPVCLLPSLPVSLHHPRGPGIRSAPRFSNICVDTIAHGSPSLCQFPSSSSTSNRRHLSVRCQATAGRSDDEQAKEPEGLLARPIRPGGGFGDDGASSTQEAPELGDWRSFRAALVAQEEKRRPRPRTSESGRWAHKISTPERGCLLLAKRLDVGSLFMHSVVFLVGHGKDDLGANGGSVGFIINLPSPGIRLSECGFKEDLAEPLRDCLLYKGGPVCESNLYVLHACPTVENANPVLEGIYTGGLKSASEQVKSGVADARQFKMLSGYAGWGAGQLECEIAADAWWLVAASVPVIKSAIERCREGSSALHEKKGLWQEILRLAGVDPTIYPPHLCQ